MIDSGSSPSGGNLTTTKSVRLNSTNRALYEICHPIVMDCPSYVYKSTNVENGCGDDGIGGSTTITSL